MSASVQQANPGSDQQVDARALYSKISWRLIPYIFILYILAYLDRVNVGFAAVEMRRDLNLSATVYGLGGGIFFLGQLMFDLPSNLLLGKVGPRLWIARIMITWGIVATCMMFVKGAHSFYLLRFLLGVSEAGFFPGMILYLTYWFPSGERARAIAKFMTATSIAGVVGGPISSFLLSLEGKAGLHGWQWLFLMEGLPTFLMGISVLFVLNDHPDDAGWLSDPEKKWLDTELERDRKEGGASEKHNLLDAFKLPMVWVLAGIFMLDQIGVYTVNLWMPLLLNSFLHVGKLGDAAGASVIARYATVPYIAAAIFTVIAGWSSDKTGERRWHIAGCFLLSVIGFTWAAYAHSLAAALCAMTLAAVGYWSMMGPFWALPTRVLGGQAAAGGVAIITMIGSIGGFVGPTLTGKLKDLTGNFTAGLLVISGLSLVGACLCIALKPADRKGTLTHPEA
ncbi:MFS transporter [Granulicella tundricola]|uniref:Major facilitator superfamily MFS_1 n=1 Tax=Granulicella tundricola (strain ATCC BAA-1859 / DSM 23138 / MP5ACTX9) TaxID=1198114 RepID=E8X0F3_GRATM|nr:MFS transporter [Granulicella tundricola]ADW67817.1 major facilitator superfamily MFS_1 [Granulicella tundricola MP5ACTX9]